MFDSLRNISETIPSFASQIYKLEGQNFAWQPNPPFKARVLLRYIDLYFINTMGGIKISHRTKAEVSSQRNVIIDTLPYYVHIKRSCPLESQK